MMVSITGSSFANSLWTSASGLMDASTRAANVAHNVANMNTKGFEPDTISSTALANGGVATQVNHAPLDSSARESLFSNTDLATEMTNLVAAKRAYQANATVIRETDDTWKRMFSD